MSNDAFEFRDFGLEKLLKALKGKEVYARVGVLGDKNSRSGDNSNAEILKKHEFGEITKIGGRDVKLPERSVLRVPIMDNMKKYLKEAGAFDEKVMKQVIKDGSLVSFAEKVGLIGLRIVQDAFSTGGFGKWKKSNMRFKKNHQTLVETQQLRNSITYDVVEK